MVLPTDVNLHATSAAIAICDTDSPLSVPLLPLALAVTAGPSNVLAPRSEEAAKLDNLAPSPTSTDNTVQVAHISVK